MIPTRFSAVVQPFYVVLLVAASQLCFAQAVAAPANSDATYQALRKIGVGNDAIIAENIVLKREFGTFTFRSGVITFAAPVNGKVTGAVFTGEGSLVLAPPSDAEKRSLSILTKTSDFKENFSQVVLRFTDGTYEELKKAGPAARDNSESAHAAKALADNLDTLHNNRETRYNLSARILQDVLATTPGGFFAAFINGKEYNGKEVFIVDPQGVRMYGLEPEEVAFVTYDENKLGYWAVSHLAKELGTNAARGDQFNAPIDVQSQKLDVEMEKSGELRGTAVTTFTAAREGIRVAPFSIFRHFKVESVTDEAGKPLPYIFEQVSFNRNESDDHDNFNVILPRPLALGEKFAVKTVYGGKDAVTNEGGGNYFPVARDDWFPYTRLGDYADFEMTFRIPKGMKIAATGTLLDEKKDGDWDVSHWKSEVPIGVAGFNFGKFKNMEDKLKNGFLIESYANETQPDWVQGLQHYANGDGEITMGSHMTGMALGTMDTTGMMKKPLLEAEMAVQLYSSYFGPVSYKRLSMTQQTACDFGQAWPGLVWLPICSYFDTTVRHQLGVDDTRQPYWSVVAAHEIAHQWWGHTVGWASYRDQWMSEGFAQESASIYLQAYYTKDPGLYQRFWKVQQENLSQKNQFGFRPNDVGPVTMGYRVSNSKTGDVYTDIAYGKGGFILHMIHMMMWDPKTGDQVFKEMMQDFLNTYRNRPASTEDFKAMVEKHMTPQMDLDGNHRMDWFFNEYVYGTELPKYDFSYNITNDANGPVMELKLSQSGVSNNFKMIIPVYIELNDGKVGRLGSATLIGNTSIDQKVPLGKITPKKVMINYHYDVLSAM
jgi:hypothetical protein